MRFHHQLMAQSGQVATTTILVIGSAQILLRQERHEVFGLA